MLEISVNTKINYYVQFYCVSELFIGIENFENAYDNRYLKILSDYSNIRLLKTLFY